MISHGTEVIDSTAKLGDMGFYPTDTYLSFPAAASPGALIWSYTVPADKTTEIESILMWAFNSDAIGWDVAGGNASRYALIKMKVDGVDKAEFRVQPSPPMQPLSMSGPQTRMWRSNIRQFVSFGDGLLFTAGQVVAFAITMPVYGDSTYQALCSTTLFGQLAGANFIDTAHVQVSTTSADTIVYTYTVPGGQTLTLLAAQIAVDMQDAMLGSFHFRFNGALLWESGNVYHSNWSPVFNSSAPFAQGFISLPLSGVTCNPGDTFEVRFHSAWEGRQTVSASLVGLETTIPVGGGGGGGGVPVIGSSIIQPVRREVY